MQRRGFITTTAAGIMLPCRQMQAREGAAADLVSDWNEALLSAARKETTPPCLIAWKLAQMHLALHRAFSENKEDGNLIGAQAAASVAAALYPGAVPDFERLFSSHTSAGDNPGRHDLMAKGRNIAATVLDERKADGASTGSPYVPSDKPGQWRRTPPAFRPPELPHWASTTQPFLIKDANQFLPPPPPELSGPAYAKALDEVRRLGAKESKERSEDQTLAARFWSDFSYTETPPGHWNAILRQLVATQMLPIAERARLFCLLNLTLADTALACWNAKYHYNTWRPETAIRGTANNINHGTAPQPHWEPLLNSPPHPEYVSGHSAFSGAASSVLRRHFGAGDFPIIARSDAVKNTTRRFTSPESCVQEISQSRIWGGIHFRFACEAGVRLGESVAKACNRVFDDSI